jgi:type II secretory pathway pseudopilin PulG
MRRSGYSLVELLVCVSLAIVVAAAGAPSLLAARDSARTSAALDYLVGQLHAARLEALKRHAYVAVRFEPDGSGGDYSFAFYVDGNGNGVRTADIAGGVDNLVRAPERLGTQFPGVRFGIGNQVPGVDSADLLDPAEPIRLGRSNMLSFSPTGTSSSGTLYLLSQGRRQSAVRVLGSTARIRTLVFDDATGRWRTR